MCYFAPGFKKNKVNKRQFFKLHLLTVAGFAWACSTDPKPIVSDLSYMPLMKGVYQVYDVDSTWYTATGEHSLHYELMTEVVDSFPNASNGYTYVIYRYKRDSPAADWQYMDTWSAWATDLRVVVSEGNTSFVKFVLPVSEGVTWNGNSLNNLGEDEYQLVNTRKPFSLEGKTYEDCIEVNQNDDDDMIVKTDIRREIYARGKGLILREARVLNYCTSGCVDFGEIESGVVYSQKILEYGNH